jgi:glycosyltransferase involved in cell wall biosynthesis
MVALEALAMGVPTIVTDGSGVGRTLSGQAAGLVVESHSSGALCRAIQRVLAEDGLAANKSRQSRTLAISEYDWNGLAGAYAQLYTGA